MQLVEEGLSYYMKKFLEMCNFHTDFFHYLFFQLALREKKITQEGTWRKLEFSFSSIISDFQFLPEIVGKGVQLNSLIYYQGIKPMHSLPSSTAYKSFPYLLPRTRLCIKQMTQLHTLEATGRLRQRHLESKDRYKKITASWRKTMIRQIPFYNQSRSQHKILITACLLQYHCRSKEP